MLRSCCGYKEDVKCSGEHVNILGASTAVLTGKETTPDFVCR